MSENVESNPSGESPDSPAENSTDVVVEGPAKPFARVKGRIVLPDGKPVRSGVVVFDPIPDRVHVALPDGSSMIGSRVRIELDKDGRIVSDENPYLDIVGCDTDGVTPAGVWSYLIRVSTGGITRRSVKSLKAGSSYDLSDLLSGKEEESSSGVSEELAKLIDERLKKFEIDKNWSKFGYYSDHNGHYNIGFIESDTLQNSWDDNSVFIVNQLSEISDKLKDFDTNYGASITIRDAIDMGYNNGVAFDLTGLTSTKKYDGIRPGILSEEDRATGKIVAKPVEEKNQYFPKEDRETGLTIPEQLRSIAEILLSYADSLNEFTNREQRIKAAYPRTDDINDPDQNYTVPKKYVDWVAEQILENIVTITQGPYDGVMYNGTVVQGPLDQSMSLNSSYMIQLMDEVKSVTPDPKTNRIWKGIAGFAADSNDNAGLVFDDPINEVSWAIAPYDVGGGLTLSCQTRRHEFNENIDSIDTSNYPEVFRVEINSDKDPILLSNRDFSTTFFGMVRLGNEQNVIRSREPSDEQDVTTKRYVDSSIKSVTSEKKFDLKRINPGTGNSEPVPGKSSIEDLVKNYNELVDFVASMHGHE